MKKLILGMAVALATLVNAEANEYVEKKGE
jgi:hypothetical protein